MAWITLYGLDEQRRVIATKIFAAGNHDVFLLAEGHLDRYPEVEVWEGSHCRLKVGRRSSRRSARLKP